MSTSVFTEMTKVLILQSWIVTKTIIMMVEAVDLSVINQLKL